MAFLRMPSAAMAALPLSHNGTHLSHFSPSGWFSCFHEQNLSLSFLKHASRGCSFSIARSPRHPLGVFTPTTGISLGGHCGISANVFASATAIQTRHCAALLARPFPLKNSLSGGDNASHFPGSIGKDSSSSLLGSLPLSEETRVFFLGWISTSHSTSNVTLSLRSEKLLRDSCNPQDAFASSCSSSPTSPKVKKTAALSSPVALTRAAPFKQERSFCSCVIGPCSSIDRTARSMLPGASCTPQLAAISCGTRVIRCVGTLPTFSGPPQVSNAPELAILSWRRSLFCFFSPRRSNLPSLSAASPLQCEMAGSSPAGSSLSLLSPSIPPPVMLTATPIAAASVSLSAPTSAFLGSAAGTAAKGSFLTSFPAAFTGFGSSVPAPTTLAWERQSIRFLGARTRRQREEMEKKVEQQRNSQLTSTQYSVHPTHEPGQQPRTYNSSYYQQVPPAGGAAGLSLGWQITIAFISSIAFYFGFVMMMRLFGGHRVVAVHVDQYGRPVDPLTGQPRC